MYTIKNAKEAVKSAIRGYLHKDIKGNYVIEERHRNPIYLEGVPGIGKTEIVKQISNELGIGYVSFSLTHHTRNSLLGLPVIVSLPGGEKYTTYTMSEIIATVNAAVESGYQEGILLLDEFPCMSETIMPAMLAFLQYKNIGMHQLPEGWILVMCGNPPEYNKSARRLDSAVLDRVRKFEITFDADSFIAYGEEIGLETLVLTYLKLHPDHAYRCLKKDEKKELVTCRGWENLAHAYGIYQEMDQDIDIEFVKQFIKSDEIADDFFRYEKKCRMGISMAEMEEILEGTSFKKYRMLVGGLTYRQKWLVTEELCELLTRKQTIKETGMGRYKEISGWINNVFDLLEVIDEKGVLSEKAFQIMSKNELLLKTVSSVETEQYNLVCKRLYGNLGESEYVGS